MINRMKELLKMLFCKHDWVYVRRLHGDEIIWHNWKRNEYRCSKCGVYKWVDEEEKKEDEMDITNED